jgi:hypothetical protein
MDHAPVADAQAAALPKVDLVPDRLQGFQVLDRNQSDQGLATAAEDEASLP